MVDVIRLEGLHKSFRSDLSVRRKEVLRGVDLKVGEGKVFGFLGPNGAGKTTTIKVLVGLVSPTSGVAEVLGEPAGVAAARRLVGFLPENPYFYEYLTPEEALHFYGSLFSLPRAERRVRVERLLQEYDLHRVRSQRVKTFSKGMRQRLGMAQALVGNPRLVILDEPLSGLDPNGRHRIKEAIRRLNESGVTVFFSSHILADVEALCDEVGLMVAGRVRQAGRLHELLSDQTQRFQISFHGLPAERIGELQSAGIAGQFSGEAFVVETADPNDVRPILDRVHGAGGQLVHLVPVRDSLEDYYVRLTKDES